MATIEELQARLSEAEAALHGLQLGKSHVSIRDASGRQITYQPASQAKLEQYIAVLKQQLGLAGRYRSIRVNF
jgi:hypothetical protein